MENIMDRVLYERKGHVGIINLDFVSDLNYCDILGYKAINEAILRLRDDEEVWVGIIQAAPGKGNFCAGADLSDWDDFKRILTENMGTYLDSDMVTPKPIIIATNGWTIGEGFNFVMAGDIIISHPDTKFWANESKRGVNPVSIQIKLTQKIGYNKAMGFMIPGDVKDVEWGDKVGLVNEICKENEDVRDVALKYAERIVNECAPMAVQGTKVGAWEMQHGHEDEAISKAIWARELCIESKDLKESWEAFKEKRKPVFKYE